MFAPNKGTIVPEMGTIVQEPLSVALFSKSRRVVLSILYGHPDRTFYLREIADMAGLGMGQIQRELKRLAKSGIIRRFEQGRHVYFQADENCPIYGELRSLVTKTVGATEVLREALQDLTERIAVAFVYGSVARGEERHNSDLDLLVIGDVSFGDVIEALSEAQSRLQREINAVVYPGNELSRKLADHHHFLTSVMESEKIFIIGDEHELRKLLKQQVD
jgi:predicted nucleotidyltransferase